MVGWLPAGRLTSIFSPADCDNGTSLRRPGIPSQAARASGYVRYQISDLNARI